MDTPAVIRTCVGCRQRAAKHQLLRVVAGAGPDGEPVVVPDPRGTAPGRGAHLHPTTECLELAQRRHAFPRALRVAGGLSTEQLQHHLTEARTTRTRPTQNWSTSS